MMSRIEVLRTLATSTLKGPIVSTCGLTSRELASLGISSNHLYVLNSMGLAGPIGLGLALGCGERAPEEKTLVIEGDGGLLMGLNFLASVAYTRPTGFMLMILDNGAHCSTGCQPTAASKVDLGLVAEGFGLPVFRASEHSELEDVITAALETTGPVVLHVRISTQSAPGVGYFQPDPPAISSAFVDYLRERDRSTRSR